MPALSVSKVSQTGRAAVNMPKKKEQEKTAENKTGGRKLALALAGLAVIGLAAAVYFKNKPSGAETKITSGSSAAVNTVNNTAAGTEAAAEGSSKAAVSLDDILKKLGIEGSVEENAKKIRERSGHPSITDTTIFDKNENPAVIRYKSGILDGVKIMADSEEVICLYRKDGSLRAVVSMTDDLEKGSRIIKTYKKARLQEGAAYFMKKLKEITG